MKNRHTKTLIEKYGQVSVLNQCEPILKSKNRWEKEFNQLPYLGITYVDWDDKKVREELIYYFEDFSIADTSLIKVKILAVDDIKFTIAHYDDHHHDICLRTGKTSDYIVEGNILKSKKNE